MAVAASAMYPEILLLLGGAVVSAPLFKRIGLGTVLGYLAAGVAIGPAARLITDGEEILHVAELGIVFLLFIIGLEIKPSRLWSLQREIFGLGLAQVVVTGVVLAALSRLLVGAQLACRDHHRLRPGAVVDRVRHADPRAGRHDQHATTARRAFSILLFQDLAIVPLLAFIPLLAPASADAQPGFAAVRASRSARLPRCCLPAAICSTRCSGSSPTPAPRRR